MIVVVDVVNALFRGSAASAKSQMTAPDGTPVGPLYGALGLVTSLLAKLPDARGLVFCSDPVVAVGSSWRRAVCGSYKSSRKSSPLRDAVRTCAPLLRELATHLPCIWLEDPEEEADDLVGWVAHQYQTPQPVLVVSTDHDLLQLVVSCPRVRVLTRRKGKDITVGSADELRVLSETLLGSRGEWLADARLWQAVRCMIGGDDDVPGIRGVGPKTAVRLANEAWGRLCKGVGAGWHVHPSGVWRQVSSRFDRPDAEEILERNWRLSYLDPQRPVQSRSGFDGNYDLAAVDALLMRLNFRSYLPGGSRRETLERAFTRIVRGF